MLQFLYSSTRVLRSRANFYSLLTRRAIHNTPVRSTKPLTNRFIWGGAAAILSTAVLFNSRPPIYLDAAANESNVTETAVDPATLIEFPTTIRMPSKTKTPPMTLVGLGVRTVSFLSVKVYSIGFYADLENPNLKMSHMSAEEKIEHIVRNSACLVRIVPVRTTSYTHLRDAFMRALQARLSGARKLGTLSEDEAYDIGSPMRKLKSLFPNSPLEKHHPLDIFLSAPSQERPRALVFRDLGSIESDWVATQFVLHYFEGLGPSPALKKSVTDRLDSLES